MPRMEKQLLIVESPAKAKTLKKYLGKGYEVLASYGHVRDLKPKEGAVEPDNGFTMHYQIIDRNAKHVDTIVKALGKADTLLLATDPDREGEAISWHLNEILKTKKAVKDKPVKRVIFHEITKSAVQEAIANPRELSVDLINAQQARRALDYLVGFNLSPLLWRKIRRGLSAGRVQSPALRLIVEREEEIEKFKPKEYWTIEADCQDKKAKFKAKLTHYNSKKLSQFTINNETLATDAKNTLLKAANGNLIVEKVEKKQRKRNPAAPFITSTLQQEAARKLGFSAQRTMRTAQQLYEGVEIGQGTAGLITYMRTDSVNLSNDAIADIRQYITKKYGNKNIPDKPRIFKTSTKNAQEAHEAIRPTSVMQTPSIIKQYLTPDQFKLYDLIHKRTVACQMVHATIDTVSVDLNCGDKGMFRATGSTIRHPGFMAVYLEGTDDNKPQDDKETILPAMEKGQSITLNDILANQHFTEPPPRFSEASLVKALEEFGIGRPSTYASIISTLQQREYATLEKKRFYPTDVGRIVSKFLNNYFSQYVDYTFTANLEDELDAVARGETEWVPLLEKFWSPFKEKVDDTLENVSRKDVTQEATDEKCPECEKPLVIRLGRSGRFYGCTGYPDCGYTRSLTADGEEEKAQTELVEGRQCPACEADLCIRTGRYGKFIGCTAYPKCKHIEPLEKPQDTNVNCPSCQKGTLLKRKSRRGKIFFSCSTYPKCKYAIWNEPIPESCPKCTWPILTKKITKKSGEQKVCPQKDCGYIE